MLSDKSIAVLFLTVLTLLTTASCDLSSLKAWQDFADALLDHSLTLQPIPDLQQGTAWFPEDLDGDDDPDAMGTTIVLPDGRTIALLDYDVDGKPDAGIVHRPDGSVGVAFVDINSDGMVTPDLNNNGTWDGFERLVDDDGQELGQEIRPVSGS